MEIFLNKSQVNINLKNRNLCQKYGAISTNGHRNRKIRAGFFRFNRKIRAVRKVPGFPGSKISGRLLRFSPDNRVPNLLLDEREIFREFSIFFSKFREKLRYNFQLCLELCMPDVSCSYR